MTGRAVSRTLLIVLLSVAACTNGREKVDGTEKTGSASAGESTSAKGQERGDGEPSAASDRVTLTEAAVATAGIVVEPVRGEPSGSASGGLEVPGQVDYDPSRVAVISPRTAGRVERLLAVEGDRVAAGQTVAQLNSPAFLTAQSDLQQAARRAAALEGTPDAEGAAALVSAARRRLRLLGVSDGAIRRLETAGAEPATLLPVPAPFGGTIVEAPALAGTAVEPGTPLYRIADLTAIDVIAQVPERSLALLHVGQQASVGIAAYPDLRFSGHVERIKAELDPATRTVKAVLHVANTRGVLRPGMFASVRLDVPIGSAVAVSAPPGDEPAAAGTSVVTIPESAVVSDGERRFVFAEVGPRTYERREVRVASVAPPGSATATSGRVAVLEGLAPGDRVVVHGAFTLKSELAKAAFVEDED